MLRFLFLLLSLTSLIISIQSCNPKIKNKVDLLIYINNHKNGLMDTLKKSDVTAKVKWQPWQLIANRLSTVKNKQIVNSEMFSENLYFILSFSSKNKEVIRQLPFDKYSEMVQVLSFRMSKFISAKPDEGISVAPAECLFQQTYGMTDANMLLIIFNKRDLIGCKDLTISIKEFGLGIGNLKFRLNADKIEKISQSDYLKTL